MNVDGDGDSGDSSNGKKVEVCHEGNTIEVDESAVPEHLEHGDTLGRCPESIIEPIADAVIEPEVGPEPVAQPIEPTIEPAQPVADPVIDPVIEESAAEPDTGSAETDVGEDPV